MKLEISLFRFDKDSDYLPYYTKHFNSKRWKNLLDILKRIHENEEFSFLDSRFIFMVNKKFYCFNCIRRYHKNIWKRFDKQEPISKRAYKDFLINEDDFIQILK